MKYSIAGIMVAASMCLAGTALAYGPGHHRSHHSHHSHHSHGHSRNHWIVPALIGGAVVYAATRPQTVIVTAPPVVVPQDSMILDGVTYRRQIMIMDGVSREVWVRN